MKWHTNEKWNCLNRCCPFFIVPLFCGSNFVFFFFHFWANRVWLRMRIFVLLSTRFFNKICDDARLDFQNFRKVRCELIKFSCGQFGIVYYFTSNNAVIYAGQICVYESMCWISIMKWWKWANVFNTHATTSIHKLKYITHWNKTKQSDM